MRQINQAGLNLIKSFEALRLAPYQDVKGIWTIGYGHTRGINSASKPINALKAENWLLADLIAAQQSVERLVRVALTDNQYAALVSLTFNAGTAPLLHTLGTKLNASDYIGVANEFLKWNHAGASVVAGLTRRREAEKTLFLL